MDRTKCFLSLIGALTFLLGLSPSLARAQCSRWDASGEWNAEFPNGASERLEIVQTGSWITGVAHLHVGGGEVLGTLEGNELAFSVRWKGQEPGRPDAEAFKGTIGSDGKIQGGAVLLDDTTFDLNNHKWTSSRPMKCLDKFTPIHKLRVKPSSPPTAETKAATSEANPLTPPYIVAAPSVVILTPPQLTGQTTLVWDAGADHPYAEIWKKVNDGDETFVVEKGKGQLVLDNLARGIRYTYILTDSGKTLGTVTIMVVN